MNRQVIFIAIAFLLITVLFPKSDVVAFDRHKLSISIGGGRSNYSVIKKESRVIPPYLPEIKNKHKDRPSGNFGLSGRLSYRILKAISIDWLGYYSQKTCVNKNKFYRISGSGDYANRVEGRLNTDSRLLGSGFGFSIHTNVHNISPVISFAILLCKVNTNVNYNENYIDNSWNLITKTIKNEIVDWGYLSSCSFGFSLNFSGKYSLTPFIGYRYSNKVGVNNNDYGILTKYKLNYTGIWSGLYFTRGIK